MFLLGEVRYGVPPLPGTGGAVSPAADAAAHADDADAHEEVEAED